MRDGACAGPVGRHKIGDAAPQIAQLDRDNRGCDRPNCDVWTYLATDVAKSGLLCDGLPVSAVSKARSAGIAALEPCARAEIATLI